MNWLTALLVRPVGAVEEEMRLDAHAAAVERLMRYASREPQCEWCCGRGHRKYSLPDERRLTHVEICEHCHGTGIGAELGGEG